MGPPLSDARPPAEAMVERILKEIVSPVGYVKWEYLSRQRLLAGEIIRSTGLARGRILDVGCGAGALSLTLREITGSEIAAMDILPERIDATLRAREKRSSGYFDRLHLLLADADHGLPFRPETFDVVVATEVIEHLDNPEGLLHEVHRVLRPGGRFFLTTPNADALPFHLLKWLPKSLVEKFAASLTQMHLHPELMSRKPSHPDEHRREGFTMKGLRALGERASLRIVQAFSYRIPLPDKLMNVTPKRVSRRIAAWGTRPMPLGLQVYCEFARAEDSG